jgi:hypothetical protein
MPIESACYSHKVFFSSRRLPVESLRVVAVIRLSTSFSQERPFHHSRGRDYGQGSRIVSGPHTRSWYLNEDVYRR